MWTARQTNKRKKEKVGKRAVLLLVWTMITGWSGHVTRLPVGLWHGLCDLELECDWLCTTGFKFPSLVNSVDPSTVPGWQTMCALIISDHHPDCSVTSWCSSAVIWGWRIWNVAMLQNALLCDRQLTPLPRFNSKLFSINAKLKTGVVLNLRWMEHVDVLTSQWVFCASLLRSNTWMHFECTSDWLKIFLQHLARGRIPDVWWNVLAGVTHNSRRVIFPLKW